MKTEFIVTLTCPGGVAGTESGEVTGRVGIESALFDVLRTERAVVTDSVCYQAPESGRLFMRVTFCAKEDTAIRRLIAARAATLGFEWTLAPAGARPRVVILTSRHDHCAEDLLLRLRRDELAMSVAAMASNHPEPGHLAAAAGVPFHHLPVIEGGLVRQELALLDLLTATEAELLILARYMRVLSPALVAALPCPAINIHHSLLPAFKGAKPYTRAHEAGVRVIGATAHYVTAELDEGPIIEQDVLRISHRDRVADLVHMGRELECRVLARAVRLHLDRRLFRDGGRTVVL